MRIAIVILTLAASPAIGAEPSEVLDAGKDAKPDGFGHRVVAFEDRLCVTSTDGTGKARLYRTDKQGKWSTDAPVVLKGERDATQIYGYGVAMDRESLIFTSTFGSSDLLRWGATGWRKWDEWLVVPRRFGEQPGDTTLWSATVSGEWAAVGVQPDRVYLFRRAANGAWAYESRFRGENWALLGGARAPGSLFGQSLSLAGDRLIVGDARTHGDGLAYFFTLERGQWLSQGRTSGSGRKDTDAFGSAVAASDKYAVIGAKLDDQNGAGAGAVYVLDKVANGWKNQTKVVPKGIQAGDGFGTSVAVLGERILVGGGGKAAFLFEKKGGEWVEVAQFPARGPAKDRFGFSCALTAKTAFVGAPGEAGKTPGAVFVFPVPSVNR